MVDVRGERVRAGLWPCLSPASREVYLQAGWTRKQVNALDVHLHTHANGGAPGSLRGWLLRPPEVLHPRITPRLVRSVYATYGHRAAPVLNAYCAGASPRFVATLTAHTTHQVTALDWDFETRSWVLARGARLGERAATGWAATGWLYTRPAPHGGVVDDVDRVQARLSRWVTHLGPRSYLWALAGYTLPEARVAREKGLRFREARVSNQQLRVMVALAGPRLPAGV